MDGLIKHFSHDEHPLTLVESERDEIIQKSVCYGCQTTISLEPTYTCANCNIFLHKKCAELPREIKHPMHNDHPLTLVAKPPYKSGSCGCDACRKSWSNFTYHCSSCQFDIDVLCAFTDRKFEHPSHKHPLTLVQRPALFECNACDEKGEEDGSFLCTTCPFWIHKRCGLLPRINQRQDHDHPLSLAYCLPIEYRGYGFSCEVCLEELQPSCWVYHCGPCRYFVHIRCITAKTRPPDIGGHDYWKPKYVQLPNDNLVEVIEYYSGVVKRQYGKPFPEIPEIKIESHKHSLVLSDVRKHCNSNNDKIICDGCMEPISSSYYICGLCNFFLHITCAQLPIIDFPDPGHYKGREHKFNLFYPKNTWELVKCNACNSNCSGYLYKCEACDFFVDVKCGCLRGTIEHKGHKHPLGQKNWIRTGICSACGISNCFYPFSCSACGFYLGLECAMLPQTVKYRWDKHELILSYPPYTDVPDQFYCEICEEEIHPKRWTYRCTECDQSFHPHCIPTLGTSRNIKFGRTLEISNHPHPLKLVPEGCAAEAWKRLEKTYASKSHTRIMGLRETLGDTTTENLSVADYMQTVKSISEALALAGSPMSDAELIHAALKGLGPEFKPLSSAIRARDSLISFEELHDKLADYELSSKRANSTAVQTPITAQFNQRTNSNNKGRNPRFTTTNHMSHSHTGSKPLSQGYSNNRVPQSNRTGFQSGQPRFSTQAWQPQHQSSQHQHNSQRRPVCQLCDKPGHTAKTCWSFSSNSSTPQANFSHATTKFDTNQPWIVDSGASHHITNDLQNLSVHSEYGGNDDIIIGDGSVHGGITSSRTE